MQTKSKLLGLAGATLALLTGAYMVGEYPEAVLLVSIVGAIGTGIAFIVVAVKAAAGWATGKASRWRLQNPIAPRKEPTVDAGDMPKPVAVKSAKDQADEMLDEFIQDD
ncbi:MAG: hypothetical protein OXK77_17275 [Gemmatimonadota bacterium]|nr:hypothetical protein [Gemmatimonadota bacterium]MDE2865061.1 hypothetical protein [Gemmatimonadota bacterium]